MPPQPAQPQEDATALHQHSGRGKGKGRELQALGFELCSIGSWLMGGLLRVSGCACTSQISTSTGVCVCLRSVCGVAV